MTDAPPSKKTIAALKDGQAPVYLLHGDEAFLTRRAAHWLKDQVLAGAPVDFNLDRFDARERVNLERVVDCARTLPMMAAHRLVWVSNFDAVITDRRARKDVDALKGYIADPDPSTCLLLQASRKCSGNHKLVRAAKKHGCVLESAPLRERELGPWLMDEATGRGRRIQRDAAMFLVETVGRDIGALVAALDRLCLYVEDGDIRLNHVEETVAHTRAHTIWELLDALADRDLGAALQHSHELSGQGEAALKQLAMIARQFRQLLEGRAARARGDNPADAAGIPPFRADRFRRQLDRYSGAELIGAMERIAQVDRALKGSKLPDVLILEGLLMDLCLRQ
jgi:DNA polymerase-3 subunit delta